MRDRSDRTDRANKPCCKAEGGCKSRPYSSLPVLFCKQRLDEAAAVEELEVVDLFADADVFDRQVQFAGDREHDAAFRGAVELGHDEAGDIDELRELAGLLHGVLAGGAVEHEQHFVRRFGNLLLGDAHDLGQLLHQVALVVQAARRIDQHHVRALRYRRADRVEHHRGGIGTLPLADDRHSGAVGPDFELLVGSGAEGVGGGDHHLFTRLVVVVRELGYTGGLARAVHADDHDDIGPGRERSVEIDRMLVARLDEQVANLAHHHLVQLLLRTVGFAFRALRDRIDDVERGFNAHVGGDEDVFELFEELVIHLGFAFGDEREFLLERIAGFGQPLLEARQPYLVKKAHGK